MEKNRHKKNKKHNRKVIWIVIGIFALLIIAIFMINIPDRKVHFFSTLILGSVFMIIGFFLGVFFFRTAIKDKLSIGKKIFFIFLSIDFILVSSYMIYFYSEKYQDIPYITTSNYESKVGVLTSFYVASKYTKGGTKFDVDGTHFYLDRKVNDVFVKGKTYRVEYLPHSKYVMNVFTN